MTRALDALAARPRHLGLAAVVAGLLLGPRTGPGAVAAAALLLAVTAAGGLRARPVRAGALAALLCLGALTADVRTGALERTRLGPLVGHVVRGEVTIVQAPRPRERGGWTAAARFRGEPVLLRTRGPSRFGGDPPPAPPAVGARVRVRAAVSAPDDHARILRAHATLAVLDLRATGATRGGFAGAVDALRRRAQGALDGGRDPARAALLQGMVLGQDADLPLDVRDEVRAAGLSHLTAASGANIVLLATLVLALSAVLGVPFHARWLVVLGLIAVYVPLAGGGPSIQRAGIMGAAGVVAVLAGRPAARWYAVGLAALVTLTIDPRAAGDPGWQLSFVAVLALLVLARPWAQRLAGRGVPGPVAEALAVTAAATLATAPVIALRFGTVAPLSVPANLAVAPIVAPIMWLGFVASLVGQVAAIPATVLAAPTEPLLRWILWVAHVAGTGPGAGLRAGAGVVAVVTLCALAAVGVGGARRIRLPGGRRVAVTVPAVLAGALVVTAAWAARPAPLGPPPPPSGLRVTFLDVGQGDATLLQVPGRAVLVDTGPPDGPLLRVLRRAGVTRLDALVVTHAQADHDGAAAAVLAALPVGVVLDGRDGVRSPRGDRFAAAARRRGVPLVPGRAGRRLTTGALTLDVLSPTDDGPTSGAPGADPNQRAIVARATAFGARVLLTADAESDVLARLDLGRVDVLKVPHHGSADPGLPALLERTRPLIAGIGVGERNPYGHPAPSTLKALRTVPRTVRTDRDGTVRADLGPGGWTVRPEHVP